LRSLDGQTCRPAEIIVVDSSPEDDGTARVTAEHPAVRFHHHPRRLGAHQARNLGAALAGGEVLAFIDPDMTASPQWLEQLLDAQAAGHAVVSGGVGCPEDYWARAVHFTKYGWWLDSGEPSERPQVPSGNLSLRSALFAAEGGFPARYWEGDTELSYRLRAKGRRLWHVPAAATVHYDRPGWRGFLGERWERGLDTARARSVREGWTRLELAGRTAAAPMTWFVMMFRCARYAARAGKLASWCAASPVVGLGLAAWVAGECRGYVDRLWR
jgi:GT2 family glycosyltransferase